MNQDIFDITATPGADSSSETEAALREIDDAAQLAFASMRAEALEGGVSEAALANDLIFGNPASLTETQKSDRVKLLTKRAANQRARGRIELEKVYVGAMSVTLKLAWDDLQVASACERYLGLCDLMPHTLGRRGPSVLGNKGTTTVMEQFGVLVDSYHAKGKEVLNEAQILFNHEHDQVLGDDEWITPTYVKHAFELSINAKHRGTPRIVAGMKMWDEAIRLATVLEWNGKVDSTKIADIRDEHRKAIRDIFIFARRSIAGLYKGTLKVEDKAARPVEAGSERTEQGNADMASA